MGYWKTGIYYLSGDGQIPSLTQNQYDNLYNDGNPAVIYNKDTGEYIFVKGTERISINDRRITEAEMQSMTNPPIGVLFYNTTRGVFVSYDGNVWNEIYNAGSLWNILLFEDFEGGVIPTTMTVVNDTNNKWVVGTTEKYAGTYGLYISNDNGVSANYSSSDVSHIYLDIPIPNGIQKWRMRAHWKGIAEPNYDHTKIYLDPNATYVPTAGSQVSGLIQIGDNEYNNQSTWIESIIEQDNTYQGTTVRVIISFRSDGSVQNAPSICLDNFFVESL